MAKIKLRRDTSANWQSINPILLEGEIGIVTDTNPKCIKIGDGSTAWNSLDYAILSDNSITTQYILDDAITEVKLDPSVRTKLNASGSTSGARPPVTSGFTITSGNSSTYNGKYDIFTNTEDITITISSALGNFDYGGKRKGSGQIFIDGSVINFDNGVEQLLVEQDGLFYIYSYNPVSESYGYEGDLSGNTAPTSNPSIIGTIKEGEQLVAEAGYFDAEGDAAGTHLYRWETASTGSTGTTTLEATTQAFTIPTGSTYAGKLIRLGVQTFAQTGVETSGSYTYTEFQTIAESTSSNLLEYTDISNVKFAFTSLQNVYQDSAATTPAIVDSTSVQSVKDLVSGFTGTEATEYPSYVTSEGSKAVRFTGSQFLSFGDIIDEIVNMQTTTNTFDIVALYKVNDNTQTNVLLEKYDGTDGFQFRPNGRHRISLARGSANEFNNQTKTVQPGGNPPADNYVTGPYLVASKVNLALAGDNKQQLWHWGIEMATGELGGPATGVSSGTDAPFTFGNGGPINMDLFAVAIGQNLSTAEIQALEGLMVHEHNFQNKVIEGFPILPVGHPYKNNAPLKSDLGL
ncbi:hypothetical protein WJR50_18940 [Catalinimonas sp. 4WD22]|uniref:hyaluronate lyase N-terminal domain-containing protein n=1 Tax=Catalinimonas locisalis TaxID=3133978 RepID=UPI003100E53E